MQQLPDWMYHAIEESFACQFTSVAANGTPIGLPVILNHFDPDAGTLIISSPTRMKRLENVRRHPEVAMLFSPVGAGKGEPLGDPENGWRRYFAGWARRHPPSRENLARMGQMMPGYVQRAIIRVRPIRFLGWQEGDMQRAPEIVEVNP
jgi:hypothetical protein